MNSFQVGNLIRLLAVGWLATTSAPVEPQPLLRPEKLAEMDVAILQAIADKQCPGGVLWVEHSAAKPQPTARGTPGRSGFLTPERAESSGDGTSFHPAAARSTARREIPATLDQPDGLQDEVASYHKAYGKRSLMPTEELMTVDTIFDAASLTKVVATTPAIMLLVERGQVKLNESVQAYIPEFTGEGKEKITVRQLLTHVSGLRPDIEIRSDWTGQATAIQKACKENLQTPPGTAFRYSDINFFLLGEIVQRASKTPLENFVQHEIYIPLKMTNTGYLPLAASSRRGNEAERSVNASATNPPPHVGGYDVQTPSKLDRIAPTEVVSGKPWRGVVHDPTARKMGGVAGHAGLFTTAADLARYARMLLNEGELDGARIFNPETVKLMSSVQTPTEVTVRRGLGWDIDSNFSLPRGEVFPLGSYGHTGWTGTSLWIDPFSKTFVIFLSNRNHPTESGNVQDLRMKLGTLAAEAVTDFDFTNVPAASVAVTNSILTNSVPQGGKR